MQVSMERSIVVHCLGEMKKLYEAAIVDSLNKESRFDLFRALANMDSIIVSDKNPFAVQGPGNDVSSTCDGEDQYHDEAACSEIIVEHAFWKDCILSIADVDMDLGSKDAIIELAFVMVNVLTSLCDEEYAYTFQEQAKPLTKIITQLLGQKRGITWVVQHQLLEIVNFMCLIDKEMFGVIEDGITSLFETNGLENCLNKLIERHARYEDRNEKSR